MNKKLEEKIATRSNPKKETISVMDEQQATTITSKTPKIQSNTIKPPSKQSSKLKNATQTIPLLKPSPQKQKKSVLREFPEPDEYNVLKMSGILDAYEHFLKLLCKNGLPTGRVYEYAAQEIERYQRRKLNKELKMRAELDIQKMKKNKPESPSPEKINRPSPYQMH